MPGTKFWYSPYTLEGTKPRNGALIRVEFPGLGVGHADVHPWTELGDAPLETQLRSLQGSLTSLTRNSLEFARTEAQARRESRSVFEGLRIPPSHFLIQEWNPGLLEKAVEAGFDRIKIKFPNSTLPTFPLPNAAKLRLDFNSRLSLTEFEAMLWNLGKEISQIEFFEDPVEGLTYHSQEAPLGMDRQAASFPSLSPGFYPQFLVIKPAVTPWQELARQALAAGVRPVFTSYLDHPLGQLSAAYAAAAAGISETCGLMSHSAYKGSEFSERLGDPLRGGPEFQVPSGIGFGFDDLLDRLTWKSDKEL
ncbi:hypothetical protein K2X30_06925 [bacterium]|nr:hypothetical protein [bacterium]